MKKLIAMSLATVMSLSLLAGCSSDTSSTSSSTSSTTETVKVLEGEIEMVSNSSDDAFEALEYIVDAFVAENPGVTVYLSTQASDYETLMKAKMAANDLPDIFATHGWSVARYSEYLMPINDLDFYDRILDSMIPNIANDDGEVFVLPLNMDCGGIVYNRDILAEIGKEVPATLDEFMEVCEAAKQAGYTPVYIAGKDDRQPANFLDITATSWLISPEDNYIDELADGTFDWSIWDNVAQFLVDVKDNGYFNVDAVTADTVTISEKLAGGDILFYFASNVYTMPAIEINPDVNLGMMPMPTVTADDEQHLYGGEREAYGIWKDSENQEIAIALLEFMAQPEYIQYYCEVTGMPAPFSDVEVDLGTLTEDYEKYAELRIFSYFDRVYVPDGMWAVLRTTGGGLLSGEMTVEEATELMESNYIKLLEQAEDSE